MHNIGQVFQSAVLRFGDAIAFDDGETRLTYRELADLTDRVIALYRDLGLKRGDRIAMLQRNSIAFVVTEIAMYRAGIARVAVNARLSPEEYQYILDDSGAQACIYDPEFQAGIDSVRPHLSDRHWLLSDKVIEDARGLARAEEDPAEVRPGDLAILQYTSGTTGRPKGAMITQGSKVHIDRNTLIELPDLGTGDAMLHMTPLTHASGALMLPCLYRGVRQIPSEFKGPEAFVAEVARYGATATFLVPTVIKMISDLAGGEPLPQLQGLKALMYAGSPISKENLATALDVFGESLLQFYGLSEAQFPVAVLRREDHRPGSTKLGSAGRPVAHVEVEIRGDGDAVLPAGETGEIVTRGRHVMAGYWNNHAATAKVLDADGWMHTGDVGFLDEEYYLHLVDRKNDLIISGGFNVYPLEVEHALCRHLDVEDAAVFGIPHDKWGEAVAAAVVLRSGATATAEDLDAHCKELLAGFKRPRHFDFTDELPRNSAGKLLRRRLRAPYWADSERAVQG